jgi:glycosyltransferase involved in cell wall biosynthesis
MTETMRADLLGLGVPDSRLVCIPNGVRTVRTMPPRAQSSDGPIRLLFVGRLSTEKDPLLAVDVLAELQRTRTVATLTIIGAGHLQSAVLQRVRERGVQAAVSLHGAADAEQFLDQADVLLQTSHFEGMSNVLLEAMAHGLPFLTTARSAARQFVGAADRTAPGILLNTRNAADIARCIRERCVDPEVRAAMGRAGRSLVETSYSISHVAERYLEVFRR